MSGAGRHNSVFAFLKEESGAAMVEFAIVSAVFFLAFFQLLGFGLFASTNLLAEKATQIAARTAVVRPAVCSGLPDRHSAGTDTSRPFGTNCRAGDGDIDGEICAQVSYGPCDGSVDNVGNLGTTDGEIWHRISSMVPAGTTISDLRFTYASDPNLGYLGGPYTPMVTVELTVPNETTELFALISRLAQNAGGGAGFNAPQYRVISISLPAEDLNSGTDG